jgi:hypothetical protein
MKKVGIVGARFNKFISMAQITINSSPKCNKIPFSKCGFVVDSQSKARGTNKMSIKVAYIAHACVCEFLEGERSDVETPLKINMHKNLPSQKDMKPHL